MTAIIEDSLTEFHLALPDPQTGEKWSVHALNHYNDGVSLTVSREHGGMAVWIEDPEALRSLAQWFETAANQIEETTHVRSTSDQK